MVEILLFLCLVCAVFIGDCLAHGISPAKLVFVYGGLWETAKETARNFAYTVITVGLVLALFFGHQPKWLQALLSIPLTWSIAFIVCKLRNFWLSRENTAEEEGKTLRGATLATDEERTALHKEMEKKLGSEAMKFATLPITTEGETKHFKLLGGTGTGKSTVIREVIHQARARGDRLVIADPDGGYLSCFFNPDTDIIFNPFDVRAAAWDMFAEIKTPYDTRLVAESLIPRGSPTDEWPEYARIFVSALLGQCKRKKMSIEAFWNLAMTAPQEVLHEFLAGTPAAPYTEPNNARMLGSIRSVAGTSLAALEYIKESQGRPLSVRDWIRNGTGTMFIPYQASQISSMRNLVSAWMRLGITELMEMPETDNRQWFVIDELDAIGKIDGLKDALARLRKFGGRCVLGVQSISQIYATYGEEDAATIMENCSNTLVLRCSASAGGGTSAFASVLIGDREATQLNPHKDADGRTSTSTVVVTNPMVLASEIERLPDLQGYAKITEHPAWHKIQLVPYPLPQIAERFVSIQFGYSD